ncbi:MAG: fumarylacetoacetate hydrolase family protein [Chloroflexi bacterium]|nr:fumarylacetoacetate hydrolase family protein [Chloroflexota bacterium]
MKIVRYRVPGNSGYGLLENGQVRALSGRTLSNLEPGGAVYDLADVRLLAPCRPSKIVALGLNYRSHSEEVKMALPDEPLIFLKPATAVIGPGDAIVYPPSSQRVDYEGELGVVIRKRAKRVAVRDAAGYILGYTCLNDVTARDLQARDRQWTRAKGFDTFAPIGPCIETALDPADVLVETYLNGELRQRASTRDLIFPVAKLVSFISHVMTLLPGDVIATGTSSGIGPMQKGDTVEVRIPPIGSLVNHVK